MEPAGLDAITALDVLTGLCVFILLTAGSIQAQRKKLKVLISADMEGVGA